MATISLLACDEITRKRLTLKNKKGQETIIDEIHIKQLATFIEAFHCFLYLDGWKLPYRQLAYDKMFQLAKTYGNWYCLYYAFPKNSPESKLAWKMME